VDLYLGMGASKGGEDGGFEELAVGGGQWMVGVRGTWDGETVLHAPGTTPRVTVVEVESLALEDECADAILDVNVS